VWCVLFVCERECTFVCVVCVFLCVYFVCVV